MHSTAVKPNTGFNRPGATTNPIRPVNTTSVITRGLSSANQSRSSAVSNGVSEAMRGWTGSSAPSPLVTPDISAPQLIRGSSSKVWNGGGDDTVHSSVVAPSPQ